VSRERDTERVEVRERLRRRGARGEDSGALLLPPPAQGFALCREALG